MKKVRKQYTREFKVEAVRLLETSGKSASALSQNRYGFLGWARLSLAPGSVASFLGLFDTPMEVVPDSCLELANGLE